MTFKKNQIPWNKGKKGVQTAWNKGIPQSEEAKRKNSESHKGRTAWNKSMKGCFSSDVIQKMQKAHKGSKGYWKGKKLSEEHKARMSKSRLGQGFGRKLSEETKKKLSDSNSGERSGLWRGGVSFIPYCPKFNDKTKERIRDRDNRTCQLCSEKENGRRLSIHHISYDKPNCAPNLIALCNRCNSKVNFDRDYHEALFISKLKERGLFIE